MEIYDDDGELVRATFHSEFVEETKPTVRFESCGGKEDRANVRRNHEYNEGLELVLKRLGLGGATLLSVDVESTRSLKLKPSERQLTIDEAAFPIALYGRDDYRQLRVGLGRGAARTARAPNATGGGSIQKQVRLYLSFPERAPVSVRWLDALLSQAPGGLVASPSSDGSAKSSLARIGRGQGRSQNTARNDAVELYAMAAAQAHFESDEGGCWTVEDVSKRLGDGYDLLCTRGDERLCVEVKGTIGAGESVILTYTEVDQAHANPERSILFLVYLIDAKEDEGQWSCSGGTTRILHRWDPHARGTLKPTQYKYTLPPLTDDPE